MSVVPDQWEFAKGRKQVKVAVSGPLIVNDRAAAVAAALQGVGVTFWVEHRLRPLIEAEQLVPVLGDWSPTFPGFFGYYCRRPQPNAALQAFVDFLRDAAGANRDDPTGTAPSGRPGRPAASAKGPAKFPAASVTLRPGGSRCPQRGTEAGRP